jgi:ATP adenylyltransferase
MKMSHIYQPLLIKSLIESSGTTTIRLLTFELLAEYESQLLYYERRIKGMPVPALRSHGIIERVGDPVSLNIGKLSFRQKAKLGCYATRRYRSSLRSGGWPPSNTGCRRPTLSPIPSATRF